MQSSDHPAASTHPIIFLILILPFGIVAGDLTVTLAYELSQAGVSTTLIAELIALSYVPHTWKFLWAPVVDTSLSLKKWYLLAGVSSAIGLVITNALPMSTEAMPQLFFVVVVTNVAVTFLGMAAEALMAHSTAEGQKGRAAGWFQAGNLGGAGLGGGAGLWIVESTGELWIAGVVLGVVSIACCAALWFVTSPQTKSSAQGMLGNMVGAFKEFWAVARTRKGYLGLLICFLPIGSGAASNLWAAIADNWHASADVVATANGVLSGLVSAAGCVVAGIICDRIDRKTAYALFGLALAVCAVAMALAPRTQTMYVSFVLIYAFIVGMSYAAFSAVVLETIGAGAAATKYNVFASLSNVPTAYMTLVLGWAHTSWDATVMLTTEAAFAAIGLLVFSAAVRKSRPPSISPASR